MSNISSNIWRELIVEYNKLKLNKNRRCQHGKHFKQFELVEPEGQIAIRKIDSFKSNDSKNSLQVKRTMVEEWLRKNEKYHQLPPKDRLLALSNDEVVDLDYYEEDGFLTSLRVENLKTQHAQNNSKGRLSLKNTEHSHRGLCFIDDEKLKNNKQRSNIKKPHTSHIFTPANLNVSYINPIPWKSS